MAMSGDFGECQTGGIMEGVTHVNFIGALRWTPLYQLKEVQMCGNPMLVRGGRGFTVCGG